MSRIGVFLCHCGSNIAGSVNITTVADAAKKMPQVAFVDHNKYSCSEPGQASIRDAIIANRLDRVVIGNCSPRMHEATFRKTVASAGLNPYLLEIANLREHCSWVHGDNKEAATAKAIELVRMAVAKVSRHEPLFPRQIGLTKRALVIGGGVAGIQAALDIANSGYEVVLVEREPSIGGRMAQLDKTFPTLDCSACILTPKMVEVAQHPNITLLTYAEVQKVSGFVGNFSVQIKKKTRYVDITKCTGCGECVKACPVEVDSEFEMGLGKRKAIYIPFPQGVPNKYLIDKRGYPPCRAACPAGVNAQGYVALISQGKFREAVEVVRRTMPFPGVCGRVCTHPCELDCERGKLDEPISIRALKRFVADYEEKVGREKAEPIERTKEEKVAIIGSGPAGLACAYDLIREGYPVTVFEALSQAGGLLRYGIPEYRLPEKVLDDDISYITELGVELKTNTFVKDIGQLFSQGYKAIFLATGAQVRQKMGIPGEDTKGILYALDFLKQVNSGTKVSIGKRVAVIGGGNAAIDASRSALRLGAEEVSIVYRRSRAEMPADKSEVEETEREGIQINFLATPIRVLAKDGLLTGIECIRMELGEPDASGRRRPVPVKGSEFTLDVENVIIATGQGVDKTALPEELTYTDWNTVSVDPITLETNIDGVFAGGDVVSGPSDVIAAIATGKEAAISIDRYLRGVDLSNGRPAVIEKVTQVSTEGVERKLRADMPLLDVDKRLDSFVEVERGFDEETAIAEAKRCLNCAVCSECLECLKLCEANAIDHEIQDELVDFDIGAIVVATGYQTFDHTVYGEYGGGRYPDVITSLQLERLMCASGPTEGEVVRPSDGRHPKTVVFVSCVGSRDEQKGRIYCSNVCCMYMAKQAIMLKEHDPDVQCYVFYIDVRAGGKDYEEFVLRAQEEYGALYLRGRISKIYPQDGKLIVCGEDSLIGRPVEIAADLVVLATGMEASAGADDIARTLNISYDTNNFLIEAHPKLRPVETQTDGIFLAGSCVGPRDIPESVAQGGAAAAKAVALLSQDVLVSDPMTATVDATRCVGCLVCAEVCPFSAIDSEVLRDGRTVAVVNENLCKGCGLCVATCRDGAANLRGFTQQQLFAEVAAAL